MKAHRMASGSRRITSKQLNQVVGELYGVMERHGFSPEDRFALFGALVQTCIQEDDDPKMRDLMMEIFISGLRQGVAGAPGA